VNHSSACPSSIWLPSASLLLMGLMPRRFILRQKSCARGACLHLQAAQAVAAVPAAGRCGRICQGGHLAPTPAGSRQEVGGGGPPVHVRAGHSGLNIGCTAIAAAILATLVSRKIANKTSREDPRAALPCPAPRPALLPCLLPCPWATQCSLAGECHDHIVKGLGLAVLHTRLTQYIHQSYRLQANG
jgi:hypothetical protein